MKYVLASLFILTSFFAYPQYLHTKRYTTADGLAGNQLINILTNKEGVLWVASANGVSTFDGKYIDNINIRKFSDKFFIKNMITGNDGNIWLFYSEGFAQVAIDTFIDYPHGMDNAIEKYLGINSHNYIFIERNILEGRVLFAFGRKEYTRLALLHENDFFHVYDSTIYTYIKKRGKIQLVNSDSSVNVLLNMSEIHDFVPVDEQKIILTDSSGVYLFTKNSSLQYLCPKRPFVYNAFQKSIYIKDFSKHVLQIFNMISGTQKRLLIENIYAENIWDACYTKDSVLLLATENGLINVISEGIIHFENDKVGFVGDISSILQNTADSTWWLTSTGPGILYQFDPDLGKATEIYRNHLLSDFTFGAEYDPHNRPTWTSGNMLLRKNGNNFEYKQVASKRLLAIKPNPSQTELAYIGRNGLIIEDDIGNFTKHTLGWGAYGATDLEPDNNGGWYITSSVGLFHFQDGYYQHINNDLKAQFAVVSDAVNTIWVGGEKGLSYLSGDSLVLLNFPDLNMVVTDLYLLDNNTLLIGSLDGLIIFDLHRFYKNKELIYKKFDDENGFLLGEVVQRSIRRGFNGKLYLSCKQRVVEIDTRILQFDAEPHSIIRSVDYLAPDSLWLAIKPEGDVYRIHEDRFRIMFSSVSFKNQSYIEYEYMLEGYDKTWIRANDSRKAVYTKMEDGNYVMKIRTRIKGQPWNRQILEVKIQVDLPIFYSLNFSILVLFMVFGVVVLLLHLHYKRKIKIIHTQYKQIDTENKLLQKAIKPELDYHFIFNLLSGLRTAVSLHYTDTGIAIAEGLTRMLRYSESNAKGIAVNVHDELAMIKEHIKLKKQSRGYEFLNFSIKSEVPEQEIIYIPRYFIYTHIQNIFKHAFPAPSKENSISIRLRKQEPYLYISIKDNGIGREKASYAKSSLQSGKIGIAAQQLLIEKLREANIQSTSHIQLSFDDADHKHGLLVEMLIPLVYNYNIGNVVESN